MGPRKRAIKRKAHETSIEIPDDTQHISEAVGPVTENLFNTLANDPNKRDNTFGPILNPQNQELYMGRMLFNKRIGRVNLYEKPESRCPSQI